MADDVFPLNKSGAEIQRLLNLMDSREELMAYFAGLKTTDTDPDQLMGNGWYFIQKNHIVDPVLVNSGGGFIFNARGDFSDYTRVQLFVPLDVSEGIKYRTYTATNTRSPWTDILNRTDTNLTTSGVAADAAVVGAYLNDTQITATLENPIYYDEITTPGKYVNGTATSVSYTQNKPEGMTAPHKLYVVKHTNIQRISQIILSNTTNPGVRIYKRFGSRSGSAPNYTWTWSPWNEIMDYTTAIDATLTQSGKAADAAVVGAYLNETQIVSTESDRKDYNTYTTPGKYWNGTTTSVGYTLNKPPQMTSAPHKLYVIKLTTSVNNLRIAQVILANTSGPSVRMFKRYGTQNGETWTWYDWNEVIDNITLASALDKVEDDINKVVDKYFVLPTSDFRVGRINYDTGEWAQGYGTHRISTPDIHEAPYDLFVKPSAKNYAVFVYYFINGIYQPAASEMAPRIPDTGVIISKGQQYKISISNTDQDAPTPASVGDLYDEALFYNPLQKIVDDVEPLNPFFDFGIVPGGNFYRGTDEAYDAFPFGGVAPTPITATAASHYDLNSLTTTGIYSVSAEVAPYVDSAPSEVANTAYKIAFMPIDEPAYPSRTGRQYIITDDTVRPVMVRLKYTENWGDWTNDDSNIVPMMYDATPEQVYAKFHELASAHSDYMVEYKYTDAGVGNIGTWSRVTSSNPISDVMSTAYGYVLTPHRVTMSDAPYYKDIPTLFILSGSHGYEKASVFSLYYLIKHMIENTVDSPVLRYLRTHCRIVVMPCINPYGFYHKTYTNGPVGTADTPESEWGVNLNRNWACANWVQWDPTNPIFQHPEGDPPVMVPDYKQYTGANPFSEWETRAVRDLFDIYKDNIVFAIDYHTCGRTWANMTSQYKNINSILFTASDTKRAEALNYASSAHIADVTAEFIEQYLGFDSTLPEWNPPRCGAIAKGADHTVNTAKDFFDYRDVLGCTFETFPSFKYTGTGTQPGGGGYSADVMRASEELISNFIITVFDYIKPR